jgi:hypothetical protein
VHRGGADQRPLAAQDEPGLPGCFAQLLVRQGKYEFSIHAQQERLEEDLDVTEIEAAFVQEEILEAYPHDPRGESCLVVGFAEAFSSALQTPTCSVWSWIACPEKHHGNAMYDSSLSHNLPITPQCFIPHIVVRNNRHYRF